MVLGLEFRVRIRFTEVDFGIFLIVLVNFPLFWYGLKSSIHTDDHACVMHYALYIIREDIFDCRPSSDLNEQISYHGNQIFC